MSKRLTQRDIARIAGVSQATVSLVLNGAPSARGRIPEETRERVNKAIRDTGYVADPVARRMVRGRNNILGVFTYEPAFPSAQADFFTPFLLGIEEEAQRLGYDLLLLTAGSGGPHKKIFHESNRLRLADGCLVLGREFDRDELARLVAGDFPFVAIGRRDDAGGPVPYVGADYVAATAALVALARARGHERLGYVGPGSGPEATADRWRGFSGALDGATLAAHVPADAQDPVETLDTINTSGATAVFFTELADAVLVERAAEARGLSIPRDFSIVVLGSHLRPSHTGTVFTSYAIPREEMGRRATSMLAGLLEGTPGERQVLLQCEPVEGQTLGHNENKDRS
ncbi:LacI family transcriptional regulator [Arsenicitalea aurantiaca]|uniref:LacI family transcriptional regulator n=1 Tax=Arsenicitalea aurantiaca TaxID=1783274 RepID=A0A433X3D7_9HYPH|nr:LacI family DNA-binding transcriptional regulator [Arsenicitalea aurantiaca]RUT28579.1 LacI family transcriptional regulator [Arsenicitalea aurantiaca]